MATNMFTIVPRVVDDRGLPKLLAGMKPGFVNGGGSSPFAVVLGGFREGGRMAPGSLAIYFDHDNPPAIEKNDRVYLGEFGSLSASDPRTVLRKHSGEGHPKYSFIRVTTGLRPDLRGNVMADIQELARLTGAGHAVQFKTHGSASYHQAAAKEQAALIASADVKQVGQVPAEQIATLKHSRTGLIGMVQMTDIIWAMPDDSCILIRDITGKSCRVIREKGRVEVYDATNYDHECDMLLAA